jgi:NAD(P)-dependent dehydrogenase (short-subunit alcohol dehydrogenase family)
MSRHVMIAGGSRGIGAACADLYRKSGDRVSILSRSAGYQVDLRDSPAAAEAVRRAESEHGPTDILVCTAGAARQTPVRDLTATSLREGMEAKYFSYINVMFPVIQGMVERGNGVVIPVIGTGGKLASPTHLPGGTANAALMLLVAGLGRVYGSCGVRITGISPGPVATERLQSLITVQAVQLGISEIESHRRIAAVYPEGQIPEARDLALLIDVIARPEAGLLNGATINADGGGLGLI